MEHKFTKVNNLKAGIPQLLQSILNISLTVLGIVLSIMMMIELVEFIQMAFSSEKRDYKYFLANILVFFLYFEFITMIVKYFKEDYHFPLRYFLYIGITAMVRLIIVEHENAIDTLIFSLVILVLIVSYYIVNITPRERPLTKKEKVPET
ncbi:phosphate-starvation-inducible protein PsiE [Lysinibacillus odysseyi]|uniref:Protein PsiE n=1 Tax=Lysinibacillus odysseyi 34hs-1 = NBRC 100172 TaxID=1220589 RepID=A0A0A3IF33_9BACI|nr:phosphate-starvation-inducible protein PsiE [Lysinibacillus odysseyi]KGR83294.1 phosphate-starvation-inducible protein PsiE [Lysinibacillus odysseyi 34hs-1 = NBRC 100172]